MFGLNLLKRLFVSEASARTAKHDGTVYGGYGNGLYLVGGSRISAVHPMLVAG